MSIRSFPPAQLVEAARAGNRRAIGRLLTLVERGGPTADAITDLTHPHIGGAHVVGITGAPGAGKSTLTGQLTRLLPERGLAPAVLAVDPSSPLSGGAILGDRVRMDGIAGDNVFIRSVATRGHAGGLALSVPGAVRVFDAVGFDPVIIETVGVGQVEVDVVGAADTAVVVVNPGWGDAVQANKAGLLEVADVFVVNKADRAGANDTRRDLELMLDLSHVSGQEDESGYRPPIVMTTATDGNGITEVWDAVQAHREHLDATGKLAARRAARLRYEVQSRVARIIETQIDGVISASVLDPAVSPAIHAAAIADQITSV
ncbi:MAG: methylmalonyl Co-A mutase-associated GTPase MeaB [Acidimicrobiales bacterium]|nr:methylmalonyl Co-A mutase-associated GTPase MeaB [Acidimicrobiales bacterium]MDG2217919.1 methylmalonyl Co-A mutase-associated GTPase MeaB [Acidimicrobiales bacterium]